MAKEQSNPILVISSLRGGVNNSDPSVSLPNDQGTIATNVEFFDAMIGARRLGTASITLPSSISGKDRVTLVVRHLPTTDETAAQLWVLGVTGTSSYQLAYKDTSWHDVSTTDTITLTGFSQYRWQAVTLHGKLFFALDTNVDRLHVWDGTSFRRVGLAAPSAAPTGANTAAAGTFTGTRFYRVRIVELSGSTVLRRSEPSAVLEFSPSGSKTGVTVTKPTLPGEGETHWELEASIDNANFYRIARTVVATSTYDDTQDYNAGYAADFPLSEDLTAYDLIGSAKYLTVDSDRLVWGSSWETSSYGSRVGWTPVAGASGVGNDERQDDTVNSFLDLNGFEGGVLTGLSESSNGSFFAFKLSHTYKLVRTGARANAYDVVTISKNVGALHGSICTGLDQFSHPAVYFLDPNIGPCRFGANGLEWLGSDIRSTWSTVNKEATKVVCSVVYDPKNRQVQWHVATGSSNVPDTGLILQTDQVRADEVGILHKGWSIWNGNRCKALSQCLFSDNIDAGAARNHSLRPFIGLEGLSLVHRCDTTNKDNNVPYTAELLTKPYILTNILNKGGVMNGAVLAEALDDATFYLSIVRDFGAEESTPIQVDTTPAGDETSVIVKVDNIKMSESLVFQFHVEDDLPAVTSRWKINQLAFKARGEQTS